MSARSCPDWPELMELAPDLHFKHYTVGEARLPAEALVELDDFPLEAVALCADLEQHVFNPTHTDPKVISALEGTYWYSLTEWVEGGPKS